jgi:mono/diheme cytochrome c family protein
MKSKTKFKEIQLMAKSMKMAVLFLALAIAQTTVIPSGYADGEYSGRTYNKRSNQSQSSVPHESDDRNSVKTYTFTAPPTLTPTPILDGAALYNQHCSGCHGSSKQGKSVSAIQNAISSNTGGMGSLKSLTAAQISAISGAVTTITPTPIQTFTPTPVPTLNTAPAPAKTWATYNQYCSGCHGTSKQGSSVAAIQTGISNNSGGMGSLKSLTAAQLTAIAAGL